MKGYLFLTLAIIGEIIGSSSLKASMGFTRLVPSLIVIGGYAGAFYSFSLALKYVPLGVSYAIWSGVGTAFTALIGYFFWKETLGLQHILGILLIIAGVVVLNLPKSTGAG